MKNIFTKYKLQLVKEKSSAYDVSNQINKPENIEEILRKVIELEKESQEVLYVLSLSIKSDVIGIAEVSRGGLSEAFASVAEVAKRLLLCNSAKFVIAHNHPSGSVEPSNADIDFCKECYKLSDLLKIQLLDFVIISYDELLSFRRNNILK